MSTEAFILIDTLVPLVVLEVPLGAAASVAPEDVLAAMLAAVVPLTLVHIFTTGTTLIERESPLTFTGETARCVLADTLRPTEVDIRGALVVINAGSMVLGKPRRAFASKATNGVDTQKLAVVLLSCTLIQIFTAPPVILENVAFWTRTLVTPLRVFADKIARLGGLVTLVQVHTGSPSDVWRVATFTEAVIRALVIDTLPISADIMNNLALIDICSVGHKSSSVGAELFEGHRALERADLTVGTPAPPSVTAAFGLGDWVPVA